MFTEMRDQAFEFAQKAITYDKAGDINSAFESYQKASSLLLKLAEIIKNKKLKKNYISLSESYINRCYTLKNFKYSDSGIENSHIHGDVHRNQRDQETLYNEIEDLIVKPTRYTSLNKVIGLEKAKQTLKEAMVLPILKPEWFKGFRKPWTGILLFGPPGCGKTLLARSAASEIGALFLNVDATAIFSKWVGESEKRLRAIFNYAREKTPSVIFLDELDALVSTRGDSAEIGVEKRIKTQFMTEIEGIITYPEQRVLMLGATNLPWHLDNAIRRRFEKRIFIPPPNKKDRQLLFQLFSKEISISSINFSKLAELTEGYTGSDISLIVRETSMIPIREATKEVDILSKDFKLRDLKQEDFVKTIENISPSIEMKEVKRYEEWAKRFQTA
ncbi:MAG: AAA family ATPase [Candidatus Ranarchaeia archaeon]